MESPAISSTGSSTDPAGVSAPDGPGPLPNVAPANGPEGCQQSVSSGGSTGVSGAGNDGLVVKVKQVKTKVTKREKRNEAGDVVTVSWDVQVGSATVKVYMTPHGEREFYTVSYWVDGKRKRQVLPSLKEAIESAKSVGRELNKGDLGSAELSAVQRVACRRALDLVEPTGVPIEVVAGDYARYFQRMGRRVTLEQLMDFYDKRNPVDIEAKLVSKVITECLESKEQDELSDRYLKQLGYDLNRFGRRFKNYIGDVAGRDIDQWLRELGVSGRTRNNIRMSVQTLFGFAKAKRYLPKDHDEMDAVPVAKELDGAIEIFTPAELREVLAAASAEMIPFLTIGAFAGVRHAEIQRLDWKDVRFDAGIIEIHAGNAKTATRRTVPILPNLRAWLKDQKEESGPVCVFSNVTDQIVSLVTKMNHRRAEDGGLRTEAGGPGTEGGGQRTEDRGRKTEGGGRRTEDGGRKVEEFKWKHNALRHSFISYRVAAIKNVAQVALEAGNSPQMIFNNYRELVTPQDAKAWFAITPKSVKAMEKKAEKERQAKIVAFPAKAVA